VERHATATAATSKRETVALGSVAIGHHETSGETSTPADSFAILVHRPIRPGLTQEELGDLLGRNRRIIQRWQDSGFVPTADQAETPARALQPVRPDLAEQVLELVREAVVVVGVIRPARLATPEAIDAIVWAAADAVGTSP